MKELSNQDMKNIDLILWQNNIWLWKLFTLDFTTTLNNKWNGKKEEESK